MKIVELLKIFEDFAPLQYQESYDNCGLLVGNRESEIKGVLLSIDITPEVLQEAFQSGCNLVIAHHPLIFKPLSKLTGSNMVEECVIYAVKNDIAVYAAHTNFDMVKGGVSYRMAEKLGLVDTRCLMPASQGLQKLICFVPESHADAVREAMFAGGAGNIGNYDQCSFNTSGFGTFRAGDNCKPYVGSTGEMHREPEIRIETIVHKAHLPGMIQSMLAAHPYEEVAYDIIPLGNSDPSSGLGVIGELQQTITGAQFLRLIKDIFGCSTVKSNKMLPENIRRVALCGGSGASLIPAALASKADAFITAEIGFHQYFQAEGKLWLLDIGHYESEQFTKEIFYDLLSKINSTFAVRFSNINTNPIKFI